jgi:aldehyde:ferredoxin oxidoreductase
MDMNETASLFSYAVGESMSADDLMTAGERIWSLERLFNLREGFARKDDTLPPRLLQEPMPSGPAKGHIVELDALLQDYYRTREWDERGVPTPEKLARLGLAEEGRTLK